jgi:hypothetical protein
MACRAARLPWPKWSVESRLTDQAGTTLAERQRRRLELLKPAANDLLQRWPVSPAALQGCAVPIRAPQVVYSGAPAAHCVELFPRLGAGRPHPATDSRIGDRRRTGTLSVYAGLPLPIWAAFRSTGNHRGGVTFARVSAAPLLPTLGELLKIAAQKSRSGFLNSNVGGAARIFPHAVCYVRKS